VLAQQLQLSVTILVGTEGIWQANLRYHQKTINIVKILNIRISLKLF